MKFEYEFQDIELKRQKLKEEFAQYIAAKNIPMCDRWQVFIAAPEYLKDKHDWIIHTKDIPGFSIEIDSEYRGKFVNLEWAVESFESDMEFEINWAKENGTDYVPEVTREQINALKEYMLENNIMGFTYDW